MLGIRRQASDVRYSAKLLLIVNSLKVSKSHSPKVHTLIFLPFSHSPILPFSTLFQDSPTDFLLLGKIVAELSNSERFRPFFVAQYRIRWWRWSSVLGVKVLLTMINGGAWAPDTEAGAILTPVIFCIYASFILSERSLRSVHRIEDW